MKSLARLGNHEPEYPRYREPMQPSPYSAYYPFEQPSRAVGLAYDILNRKDLTLGSACLRTKGRFRHALQFTQNANSYASTTSFGMPAIDELTISAWVWVDIAGTDYCQWVTLYDAANAFVAELVTADDKRWASMTIYIAGVATNIYVWWRLHPTSAQCNRWHHLAGVKAKTHFTIYWNGVPIERTYVAGNLNAATQCYLGKTRVDTNLAKGYIDDLRIYYRALTLDEINAIRFGNLRMGNTIPEPRICQYVLDIWNYP